MDLKCIWCQDLKYGYWSYMHNILTLDMKMTALGLKIWLQVISTQYLDNQLQLMFILKIW